MHQSASGTDILTIQTNFRPNIVALYTFFVIFMNLQIPFVCWKSSKLTRMSRILWLPVLRFAACTEKCMAVTNRYFSFSLNMITQRVLSIVKGILGLCTVDPLEVYNYGKVRYCAIISYIIAYLYSSALKFTKTGIKDARIRLSSNSLIQPLEWPD